MEEARLLTVWMDLLNASLRSGEWKRSKFSGVELYEKTAGIVGLGRIGVLVARIAATAGEGHGHVVACILRRLLDRGTSAEDDDISQRNLLAAGLRAVEFLLDALKRCQHSLQLIRLVHFPVLLRHETNTCTIRSAALV